jgi:hypothetical protein
MVMVFTIVVITIVIVKVIIFFRITVNIVVQLPIIVVFLVATKSQENILRLLVVVACQKGFS